MTRVVFVTDIVTPYMVAVFRALAKVVDLKVVFCAAAGARGNPWEFGELDFDHAIVDGLARTPPDAMSLYVSPRIATTIARARPRAVICGGFSVPTLYAAGYCAAARAPLLIHSDGTSYSERNLERSKVLSREVLLRFASACVANSREAKQRFRELGVRQERIFLAPHSTDVARFWRVAEDREDDPDAIRVLTVGRLIERKGIDRLLRAVALARAQDERIRLTVAGTGPGEAQLRRLAKELRIDVDFRGFADQPELPGVYRDADVFAFPTLDDPFGIVLLEAAASGLPLVASSSAGATAELVGSGESGFVVDPDDVEAMATALVTLARDPELRRRMGRAAQSATRDRTPERAAAGYAAAVETALESRGRVRSLLGR